MLCGLVHVGVKTSLGALLSMTVLQLLLGELGVEETIHLDYISFKPSATGPFEGVDEMGVGLPLKS